MSIVYLVSAILLYIILIGRIISLVYIYELCGGVVCLFSVPCVYILVLFETSNIIVYFQYRI